MANYTERSTVPMPQNKENDVSQIETSSQAKPIDDEVVVDDVSPEQHRKTFRKVDFHLMPLLMALYLISNLDR